MATFPNSDDDWARIYDLALAIAADLNFSPEGERRRTDSTRTLTVFEEECGEVMPEPIYLALFAYGLTFSADTLRLSKWYALAHASKLDSAHRSGVDPILLASEIGSRHLL